MKRSEINIIIRSSLGFINEIGFSLPKEANWSLEDWFVYWDKKKDNTKERRERGIGWDITDFNLGDFSKHGLLLYTLTNGLDQGYAKKYLIVGDGQITPSHNHKKKIEDIVNVSGGDLKISLYNLDNPDFVRIFHNYEWEMYEPGSIITLKKNDRIRIDNCHLHEFWGVGWVLAEENSSVNDDKEDNFFLNTKVGRFPEIEEDEIPRYLLCTELPETRKFDELVRKWL